MTELVKKEQQAMVPSYIDQGSNRGNENVTSDDLQLPRIDVLQALSPQVNEKKDEYIPGAKVGCMYNTLTSELYPNGVHVTPVSFVNRYLLWVNREIDKAGGLRGVYGTEPEAHAALAVHEDKDKLEVVKTAEHLMILDNGDEVILSMSKSKMKVSRKFNALVRLKGGDRFGTRYAVTSVDDEGPRGEYQNIKLEEDGYPSEKVYFQAVAIHQAIVDSGIQKGANYAEESAGDY